MKKLVMILLVSLLTPIMSFSQSTYPITGSDSLITITAEQLKSINLIFNEHRYFKEKVSLLTEQVEDLSKLIDINDSESESIKRYNQGEALFVCGSKRLQITVIATEAELDSFGYRERLKYIKRSRNRVM